MSTEFVYNIDEKTLKSAIDTALTPRYLEKVRRDLAKYNHNNVEINDAVRRRRRKLTEDAHVRLMRCRTRFEIDTCMDLLKKEGYDMAEDQVSAVAAQRIKEIRGGSIRPEFPAGVDLTGLVANQVARLGGMYQSQDMTPEMLEQEAQMMRDENANLDPLVLKRMNEVVTFKAFNHLLDELYSDGVDLSPYHDHVQTRIHDLVVVRDQSAAAHVEFPAGVDIRGLPAVEVERLRESYNEFRWSQQDLVAEVAYVREEAAAIAATRVAIAAVDWSGVSDDQANIIREMALDYRWQDPAQIEAELKYFKGNGPVPVPTITLEQRADVVLVVDPDRYNRHGTTYFSFRTDKTPDWSEPSDHLCEVFMNFGGTETEEPLELPADFKFCEVRARIGDYSDSGEPHRNGEWCQSVRIENNNVGNKLDLARNVYWQMYKRRDLYGMGDAVGRKESGVNDVDHNGNTVAHLIAADVSPQTAHERLSALGLLLDSRYAFSGAGFVKGAKNSDGLTAWDVAMANDATSSYVYDYEDIVELLWPGDVSDAPAEGDHPFWNLDYVKPVASAPSSREPIGKRPSDWTQSSVNSPVITMTGEPTKTMASAVPAPAPAPTPPPVRAPMIEPTPAPTTAPTPAPAPAPATIDPMDVLASLDTDQLLSLLMKLLAK